MPNRHCRHCGRRAYRSRGLCRRCFVNPLILELYPATTQSQTAAAREARLAQRHEPQTARPEREPGEMLYRCLWCWRFRCDGPLRRCEECDRQYQRMAVEMPRKLDSEEG